MPIGPLNRSSLDKAIEQQKAFKAHKKSLEDRTGKSIPEISEERQAKLVTLTEAYEARKVAVAARARGQKTIDAFPDQIAEQELELVFLLNRRLGLVRERADLNRQRRDAMEKYQKAKNETKKVTASIEQALGEALSHAPKTTDGTPELDPAVREWASKFGALKKSETIEFFQATSVQVGAQLDLRKIDAAIADNQDDQDGLERTIPLQERAIELLKARLETARADQEQLASAVVDAQGKIDQIKSDLEDLTYREGLHKILGDESDALSLQLIEAFDEARQNLATIREPLAEVVSSKMASGDKGTVQGLSNRREELAALLKSINRSGPLFDRVADFERIYSDGRQIADEFNAYTLTSGFADAASRLRLRLLRGEVKDAVVKEVLNESNALQPSEAYHVDKLSIDDSLLQKLATQGKQGSLTVGVAEVEALRSAAQKDYAERLAKITDRLLREKAKEDELKRLSDLDEVAAEEEFVELNPSELASILQEFKEKSADDGTPLALRATLRDALKLQVCPDPALWRRILGLKAGKHFPSGPRFRDAVGNETDTHFSFYPDCFGPAAKGKISLYVKKNKTTADFVMENLFHKGISTKARVHATLEVYAPDHDNNPHVYYAWGRDGHAVNFDIAFEEMIETGDDSHDLDWEDHARVHVEEALGFKMGELKGRIETWLSSGGSMR